MFEQNYEKCHSFLSENFQFLEVKFSIYLNRRVFVMITIDHCQHRNLVSIILTTCYAIPHPANHYTTGNKTLGTQMTIILMIRNIIKPFYC